MELLKTVNKLFKGNIYMAFDTSGSTTVEKRSIYKKIYDYYAAQYNDILILKHNCSAQWSTIEKVLSEPGGGTYMSSPLYLLEKCYNKAEGITGIRPNGNIIIQICDGDNWTEDTERFLNHVIDISKNNQYIYYETLPSTYTTTIYHKLRVLKKKQPDLNIELYIIKNEKDLKCIEMEEYEVV